MDSKINAQALNAAFPGNTLGIFDEPDAVIPDAFVPVPGPARAWVQAAVAQHAANLPRPPVPAGAAPQLLEFAHFANLGAEVELEALDAIELTLDNVLGHVSEALRFDPASLRRTEMARRIGTFVAGHAAACLAGQARRAPGSQGPELQHAACLTGQARRAPGSQGPELQFVREALTATLLAATHLGDFSAADDVDNAAALADFLVPHLALERRQELAPWLLRAGGAAGDAVLRDVRESFAQLQARSPAHVDASTHPQLDASSLAQLQSIFGERPPLLAAAARKVQTWYFGVAAKAWAPGLPASERLRLQAQTAPLDHDHVGAWPQPLEQAAPAPDAIAPATPGPDASEREHFEWQCVRALRAAEAAGTGLDRAAARRLESAFMALAPADKTAALQMASRWPSAVCLAMPGCLARLIADQPAEVRARALGHAASFGSVELIAEWAPLMLADRVEPQTYFSAWDLPTPPTNADERRRNLQRLELGLGALRALAAEYSLQPMGIDPLSVALYAGYDGLRAAAPVLGFNAREMAPRNDVAQALFMTAAPEACAKLVEIVRPKPGSEAPDWAPLAALMHHVGSQQLEALLQAQPPTQQTAARLYLRAAAAGRVDVMDVIRGHSQDSDTLITTPVFAPEPWEPAQLSLLDSFAAPSTLPLNLYPSLPNWQPEVFAHLLRAALALPPNIQVPVAVATYAIQKDDLELLRALNARRPLTPDDWWQALHESRQAQPRMLRAIAEHLAGSQPAHLPLEATADLDDSYQALNDRTAALLKAVNADRLNAKADLVPGITTLSLLVEGKDAARDLFRFKALRELDLQTSGPLDLRSSVAHVSTLQKLTITLLGKAPQGWSALANLQQLTTLEIVGRLSDKSLEELLTAGLAPKLDLHQTLLSAPKRARALAAMRDCVPRERWPRFAG